MPKYNIRQPFAVHLEVVNDVEKPDGQKVRQRTQQSFFPGQAIDLTDEQALEHLHKLEPADAAAHKFVTAFHARQDAQAEARQNQEQGPSFDERIAAAVDERVGAAVAAAVEAALAKAGIKPKG